jgi:hypothetical protein
MDLILGLIMMAVGIYAVAKKELKITAKAVSRGAPARNAGLVLICALPAVFLITIARRLVEQASGTRMLGESASAISSYAMLVVFGVAALLLARKGAGTA